MDIENMHKWFREFADLTNAYDKAGCSSPSVSYETVTKIKEFLFVDRGMTVKEIDEQIEDVA